MFPQWFHLVSLACLLLGAAASLILLWDVWHHPQPMAIMNIVWPVTALFGSLPLLFLYYRYGRSSGHGHGGSTPFPIMVGKGALHCGSGCMIGDVLAEWLAFFVPSVALALGWQSIFAEKMYAVWILDFIFAFLLGVAFQYFAIVPMRKLSPRKGLIAALKADTMSLIAWQVGMYGAMALFQLALLPSFFGLRANVNSAEFWFIMQIAMICGFITSYPVNWYLIRAGIKEKM
jgi:hypothetical protein